MLRKNIKIAIKTSKMSMQNIIKSLEIRECFRKMLKIRFFMIVTGEKRKIC